MNFADVKEWRIPVDGEMREVQYVKDSSGTMLWHKNYYIHFDGNESTSGSMDDVTAIYQQELQLPANAFVRDGYFFVDWCETADGTGQHYSDEELIQMPAGNISLYAQWEESESTLI